KKAVRINSATQIALTKLDIVYPKIAKSNNIDNLKGEALEFIDTIEVKTGCKVTLIGTGPGTEDIIDLREN
ncbi:MAG: adenylosuccinate synthetase, partial [Candidatus Heimdallarchaeota archaeon]|nr:adenylosuccinate synthetase [Candidatus Heimdallarchaeota archaeon]